MENVLSTHGLSKHYGRIKAIDQLDLDIKRGSVFGILGPNGSGKTTTLGIILDVINKTSGSFEWFGRKATKHDRKKIGAILETPIFYPYLSATKNLQIVAEIKGVSKDRIDLVLKQVGLFERRKDKFRTYSLGMKQRLSIGSALLCDPIVMILDEPTNGLDPQGIADIRKLIIDIANDGKTIILASHLLDEVQKVCTDFAVLKSGKLIYTGKVEEVSKGAETIEVIFESDNAEQILADCDFIASSNLEIHKWMITLKEGHHAAELNSYLHSKGISASQLLTQKKSLEKQFLEILNETA